MTVKLPKFFGSSNVAPEVPHSQTAAMATTKSANTLNYYQATTHHQQKQHQQPQHQQQQFHQQQPYHTYLDDDDEDDDNMSMYSTATSIMNSRRDHPFNNSQRPLLAERKPQLLNKKKLTIVAANGGAPQLPQRQSHQQQQQQQLQQYQVQQKPYALPKQENKPCFVSSYVQQQQKRDSAKGLHGFNDFDILSQQYNEHLQSPHVGYPYGSPPSPTVNSSDFVFDTPMTSATMTMTQVNDSNDSGFVGASSTSMPRYANICDYAGRPAGTVTMPPSYRYDTSKQSYYYGHSQQYQQQKEQQQYNEYMGKFSRFEDDFCTRRNVEFSRDPLVDIATNESNSGPFIFGVPPEQQNGFGHLPQGGRGFSDSTDTAISSSSNTVSNKYSQNSGEAVTQSTSDTSSSSRDSGSNKGVKFLLRRRKSKKTASTATGTASTTATTATTTTTTKKSKQLEAGELKTTSGHKQPTIKCVLVGDGAVGKTNLILSYLENRFNTEHVPTASDIYNADVMVNDSPVHLTICDTAGQDTLDPLRELCYPDSDVFLLCFSVVKPETFHAIKMKWIPKFSKTKAALILVGTQSDLRTNLNVMNKLQANGEKPVSYADAWDLATTIGAKYIETSSAMQDKVKEMFDTAIWEGLAPTTLPPTPPLWKKLFCLA